MQPSPVGPPSRAVPASDPTSVWGDASPADTRVDAPQPRTVRVGARWVPGTGWVHDGTGEIPPGARWVPGVGYVVEEA